MPKYLQIGPKRIAVVLKDLEEEGLHGHWDSSLDTIYINSQDDPIIQGRTLVHEVFHAIDELWDLELGEVGVRVLENALVQCGLVK